MRKTIGDNDGIPTFAWASLASATGVTDAAIELIGSTADNYTIIDQIYVSCGSDYTDADFTIDFVGYEETFAVEFDELGVAGMTPPWGWMDFLDPNPAANTVAWWLNKSLGKFVLAPTGDSISIDGRNAAAGDNYASTASIALVFAISGRLIAQDAFH